MTRQPGQRPSLRPAVPGRRRRDRPDGCRPWPRPNQAPFVSRCAGRPLAETPGSWSHTPASQLRALPRPRVRAKPRDQGAGYPWHRRITSHPVRGRTRSKKKKNWERKYNLPRRRSPRVHTRRGPTPALPSFFRRPGQRSTHPRRRQLPPIRPPARFPRRPWQAHRSWPPGSPWLAARGQPVPASQGQPPDASLLALGVCPSRTVGPWSARSPRQCPRCLQFWQASPGATDRAGKRCCHGHRLAPALSFPPPVASSGPPLDGCRCPPCVRFPNTNNPAVSGPVTGLQGPRLAPPRPALPGFCPAMDFASTPGRITSFPARCQVNLSGVSPPHEPSTSCTVR